MSDVVFFEPLPVVDDISGVIEDIFGIKLAINGGWGYDNRTALHVEILTVPAEQFFHTFASMRAHVEMNLTLEEEARYAGINVTLLEHKTLEVEHIVYDVVTFKITAMKEKQYNRFIQEYKENFGKQTFDLEEHFKQRQAHTISIDSDVWFVISE